MDKERVLASSKEQYTARYNLSLSFMNTYRPLKPFIFNSYVHDRTILPSLHSLLTNHDSLQDKESKESDVVC